MAFVRVADDRRAQNLSGTTRLPGRRLLPWGRRCGGDAQRRSTEVRCSGVVRYAGAHPRGSSLGILVPALAHELYLGVEGCEGVSRALDLAVAR